MSLFRIQVNDDAPCTVEGDELREANWNDEQIAAFVRDAVLGERFQCGGGAAPLYEIERVS